MAERTIFLRSGREGEPVSKEYPAYEAITPGMLCKLYYDSGSARNEMKKHDVAGGPGPVILAIEESLKGNEISEALTANNQAQFIVCGPGDEVYVMLADDQSIAVGDYLESAGNGYFQEYSEATSGAENRHDPLLQALEAKETTTSSNEAGTRIKAMVI